MYDPSTSGADPLDAAPASMFCRLPLSEGRRLVLGSMPFQADPAGTLAAGPWCFTGREDFFPDWEDKYRMGPEPFLDRKLQAEAIARAETLAADMIPRLATRLLPEHSLPEAYWETLLAPFAINVARILAEVWYRIRAMIEAWGDQPVTVALLSEDSAFNMDTDADVILHGALNPTCLHWLFSCLLRPVCPKAWTIEELAPVVEDYPASRSEEPEARLKDSLRRMLLKLPCPPIKGLSLPKMLRYSLALLHTSQGEDRSRSLHEHFASSATRPALDLPVDPMLIFLRLLPRSIRELEHPTEGLEPLRRPRTRLASILLYENAAYRQFLAIWRARGGRLACVQHGGNYGMMRHISAMEFVEYTQHAFLTWGWSEQESAFGDRAGQANFQPLPAWQLVRMRNAWRGGKNTLLFVGTEMPGIGYQLDCHPTPGQNVQYREDKQWFLEAVGHDIQKHILYRPYFPVPGTLDDAAWILPRFPRVHLCSGPLAPQMLDCKLLVLDHHGTTLLEAMAANVPTICFWDPEAWPLSEAFEKLLPQLGRAGVWHSSAEDAAVHVGRIWKDPAAWWKSAEVQEVRNLFLDTLALCPARHVDSLWKGVLRRL